MGFEVFPVVAIGVYAAIELVSYFLIRAFPLAPTVEFAKLDDAVLDRFITFDAELGHIPAPNSQKIDRDITGKHYEVICTYDAIASRASQFDQSVDVLGASFGDSFCQCRGVQDSETWQAYLEATIGNRVLNFGVGGYGLDQAYLRYLRVRNEDLGRTIIFAVSPCTIERIVGVYKNYIEFGNYLGVKPRFLEVNGELKQISLPVKSKAELKTLGNFKHQIRAVDDNYDQYFKKYRPAFPFAFYIVRNWKQYLIDFIAKVLDKKRNRFPDTVSTCFIRLKSDLIADRRNEAYLRKNLYFKKLFADKESLFVSLVRECKAACESDGRSAFLVFLPDYTNISFMRSRGHYYQNVVERLRSEVGIPVFDSFEVFRDCNPQEIFLKDNYSGHHTAKGNARLAEHLARFLQGNDSPSVNEKM